MQKIIIIIFSLFAVLLFCERQEEVFDLQKIDARQQLDEVLLEIDEQIEHIRIDTVRLGGGGLERNLASSETKLMALRDDVLRQISAIDSIREEDWSAFESAIDSIEIEVTGVVEESREYISTMTQRTPASPN